MNRQRSNDYEEQFCRRIKPILRDLGVPDHRMLDKAERLGREAAQPHKWLLGRASAGHSDSRKKSIITFDGFFYNEDEPDRGTPVVQNLGEARVIYSRVFDPDYDYKVTINEVEDSSIEEWTEDEFGVSFNVTNRTTVKAEAKAEFAGRGFRFRGERDHHHPRYVLCKEQRRPAEQGEQPGDHWRVHRSRVGNVCWLQRRRSSSRS